MYILVENNEYVRTVSLESEFSHISFPANPSPTDLPENIIVCRQLPILHSPNTTAMPDTPKFIDGEWVQGWIVQSLSEVQTQFNNHLKWIEIRKERDAKIAEVEWRVLRNLRESRMSTDTTDDITILDQYIKTLTDLPEQQSDPFNIVWPEKP